MTGEIEIRPFMNGDEERIVQLLVSVFNPWPHFDLSVDPLDHWLWKFRDNPSREVIICLALSDGEIIGCFHDLVQTLKIGDRAFLGCQGVDVAVHQDYRGQGIYGKLIRYAHELERKRGILLHYGVNTNPATIRESKKLGNLELPHVRFLSSRIRDVNRHFEVNNVKNALLRKLIYLVLVRFYKLRYTIWKPDYALNDFSINEVKEFDDRFTQFWEEIGKNYAFIVERTKNYLNWRFCDPRGGDYVCKVAENNGNVLGYVVLRINRLRESYPQGTIVDLLTLPQRLDVLEALVSHACQYFDNGDINSVNTLIVKGHPHEAVLKRFGFIEVLKPAINYKPNEALDEDLNKLRMSPPSKELFTYGDFDWI